MFLPVCGSRRKLGAPVGVGLVRYKELTMRPPVKRPCWSCSSLDSLSVKLLLLPFGLVNFEDLPASYTLSTTDCLLPSTLD